MFGLVAALVFSLGICAPAGANEDDSPVVIVGFSGITWSDVTPETAPNLHEFGENGAVANVVVRTIDETTCPSEGWMTISAGQRATSGDPGCRRVEPEVSDGVRQLNSRSRYGAQIGTLGRALADEPTLAIGSGGAVALTDAQETSYAPLAPIPGSVEGSRAGDSDADIDAAAKAYRRSGAASRVSVIDLGAVRHPNWQLTRDGAARGGSGERWRGFFLPEQQAPAEVAAQVTAVDERFRRLVRSIRETTPNATIIVASMGDSDGSRPRLGYFAAQGPLLGDDGPLMAGSTATRQRGLVQNTDIMPTVLRWVAPGSGAAREAIGSPLTTVSAGDGQSNIAALVGNQVRAQTVRSLSGPFFVAFGLLFACVVVMFARRSRWGDGADDAPAGDDGGRAAGGRDGGGGPAEGGRTASAARQKASAGLVGRGRTPHGRRRFFLQVATLTAAIPVATLLVNLLPWWRLSNPAGALIALLATVAAAIAAVALAGFWRDRIFAPMGTVAAVTTVTLTLDVLLDGLIGGYPLQLAALLGTQPLVGWRFYGFSNSAFAMFTAGLILVLAWAGGTLAERGRPRAAVALIGAVGLGAVLLDGLARFGADFGGPPVLIVGLGALALLILRIRLTWWRLAILLCAAVATSLLFAALDYMQPASQRSHLGQFIDALMGGRGLDVVLRKLAQAFGNLPWPMIGALAAVGILAVASVRWLDSRGRLEAIKLSRHCRAWRDLPVLRNSAIALLLALGVGMLLNDSGLLVPILGLATALPLWLTAVVRYEAERQPTR